MFLAGLPALQSSQSGQMRKQAATTIAQVPGVWLASYLFRFHPVFSTF